MTKNDVINKVRVLLGLQKFDSARLADGTMVEADGDFAPGVELYVIDAEGNRVPAPEGEHTTESGITVTVDAEGVITGVKRPDEEGEGSLEASEDAKKVEMEEDKEEEMMEDMEDKVEESMEEDESYISADEVLEIVAPLLASMTEMKEEIEKMRKEFEDYLEKPAKEGMKKSFAKETNAAIAKTTAVDRIKALREGFIK